MRVLLAVVVLGCCALPAAASTGNGVIAFVRNGDVWTIDPATGVQRNLTQGDSTGIGEGGLLSWSPDGSRLLYSVSQSVPASPPAHSVPMSMSADGSSKRALVDDPTRNWWPECWIGPNLVALREAALDSNSADFYAIRPDGSGLRPLTSDGSHSSGFGSVGNNRTSQIVLADPHEVCSPAAGLLFFQGSSVVDTYSLAADGTLQKLQFPYGWVSPSPDGSRLAWIGNDGLFVTGIDGSNPTKTAQVLTSSWQTLKPAQWSPDGREIAFASVQSNCCADDEPSYYSSVHVISASGDGERELSFRPKERAFPLAWSPDGTRILFQADPGFDFLGQRLFVMNAAGTCRTALAVFDGRLLNELSQGVAWQPVPGKAPDAPIACPADVGLIGDEVAGNTWLGGTTPYTVRVTNEGSVRADNVHVGVSDQTWLKVQSMTTAHGSCDASGCELGTMHPAETASVTVTLTGTIPDFPDFATGRFTLHVSFAGSDPNDSNDRLTVGAEVYGCRSLGTYGPDSFLGTSRSDSFCGLLDADSIFGRKGNDQLDGGPDNDLLDGGSGRDQIYGGSGNDIIWARDGQRDKVDCGSGRDRAVVDPKDFVTGCEKVLRGDPLVR